MNELVHLHEATVYDGLTATLKSVADALRLQVLRVLAEQSYSVQELCAIFSVRQPNMSHHLKLLMAQGLLTSRKEGNSVYYSRTLHTHSADNQSQSALIEKLLWFIDCQPILPEVDAQMQIIAVQRAEACALFFAKNTADFTENQERIVANNYYHKTVAELLRTVDLPASAHVVELGSGDGGFLPHLMSLYAHVTAIDISAEMLALAQQKLQQVVQENATSATTTVEFIHGDITQLPQPCDAVVMNMVLHHVASPQQLFKDIATVLKPDGVVLLCDLSQHEQAWVKEHCGDFWLGFSQEQMAHWAKNSGLYVDKMVFSGLRNGFQLLYAVFRKQI